MFRSLLFFLFILSVSFGFDGRKECLAGESEVNVYSHRQPFLINPFLKEFTKETGIKTNILYSKPASPPEFRPRVKIPLQMLC
jgi:hypothetical protein